MLHILAALGLFSGLNGLIDDDTIYGVGGNSCGAYVDARRANFDGAYGNWLGGYMTAADQFDLVEERDLQGMMGYLDNYCRDHPLDNFSKAATVLRRELTRPPPAPPPQ